MEYTKYEDLMANGQLPHAVDVLFEKAKNANDPTTPHELTQSMRDSNTTLDHSRFKLLPSLEISSTSDLLNGSLMADNVGISRCKSDSNSNDEIQQIKDEVQGLDGFQ